MNPPPDPPPLPKLTIEGLRTLLDQLQTGGPVNPAGLVRLMEIYCVVKAGGVQIQVEAAQAHLARETAKLELEISGLESQGLNSRHAAQDLTELHNSVTWRLALLQDITPEEEAAVVAHLPDLERQLLSPRRHAQ